MTISAAWLRLALGAALVLGLPVASQGHPYPSKPIRLVVPYGPGGIVDYVGRALSRNLSEAIGQPVLIENPVGIGVGAAAVARSDADGYTLLLADVAFVTEAILRKDVASQLLDALQTVSIVSSSPQVVVTTLSLPVINIPQLIAFGKANPSKLSFASAGIGTPSHLAGEMFKLRTGIDATHVPYKGSGAPFTHLMTGKVQMAFSSLASALPFTTDKRVRAIATTGTKRTGVYPDLPTVIEAGVMGFEVDLWLAVFAPAGIAATVLTQLHGGLQKALHAAELRAALAKVGIDPRGTEPEEGRALVGAEFEKWQQVSRDGKIRHN